MSDQVDDRMAVPVVRSRASAWRVAIVVAAALAAACGRPQEPPRSDITTTAGRPLTPEQVSADIRSYDLTLRVDPSTRRIAGDVVVTVTATAVLPRLVLDLDPRLEVTSVRRRAPVPDRDLDFRQYDGRVWIDLGTPVEAGRSLDVAITYGGAPREAPNPPWEGGFTWASTAAGEPWIGVSCQLDGADLWWPCEDHPADEPEDGVALHFTVPAGLQVVSNGRLVGVDEVGTWRTWHWRVTGPINSYNVTFNAAPFERLLSASWASVTGANLPLEYWLLPEDVERGRAVLPELVEHVEFLERLLGPYPFRGDKYAIVETPYLAMEHQTAIAWGPDWRGIRMGLHWVPLHEAAHEWFGNLVSASDWRDFWLHEGFAGYMEALWVEAHQGTAAMQEYLARYFRPYLTNERPLAPREPRALREVYRALPPDFERFDIDAYAKGALVLHSLRWLLGDEAFFDLLRRWVYPDPGLEATTDGSACRTATSDDLQRAAERISGRDLGWFFDLYLRQPELPRLEWTVEEGVLRVDWRTPPDLRFPMPVEILTEGGTRRLELVNGSATEAWPAGAAPRVDPGNWVLRAESSSPGAW